MNAYNPQAYTIPGVDSMQAEMTPPLQWPPLHLAAVLNDLRDPRRVHFTLHDLLKQRVLQIAAGYADANDATTLRPGQAHLSYPVKTWTR